MNLDFFRRAKSRLYSSRGLFVLVLVFLLSVATSVYLSQTKGISDVKNEGTEINQPITIEGPILDKSLPSRLRIPKLNIDTNFVPPLDLQESGEVGVPDSYTEVGWYKHSPTPGQLGPSIILGHVDSHTGPAIFFYLGQLQEGDDIYIDREDGSVAHFKVESLDRYEQTEFPTNKVYGNINHSGLRLITCSGIFNKKEQKYSHNLVVYARLVE